MDQDMLTLLTVIIGALIGGGFAIATVFISRGKKVITYDITSMPLFRFRPLDDSLKISVDKSILSGDASSKGIFDQIDNAYGFQIALLNIGNEHAEKPNIEIQLDESAKIISYEIQPLSRPGYNVDMQKDPTQPNILRVLVPFINIREEVIIRVISTGNSTQVCDVNVLGLGIRCKKRRSISYELLATICMGFALLTIVIINTLPAPLVLAIGGSYSKTLVLPIWWDMPILLAFAIFVVMAFSRLKETLTKERKKHAEWEIKK